MGKKGTGNGVDAAATSTETVSTGETPADETHDGGDSATETEQTGEDESSWREQIETRLTELQENFSRIVARQETEPRQQESVTVVMPRSAPNRSATESTTQPDQNNRDASTATETQAAGGNGETQTPRPYAGGVLGRRRNRHPSAD